MRQERIDYLDGLRGLAATLVVVGHVAEEICATVDAPALDRALDYAGFGRIGVVAFFCISGFVIPFSFRPPNAVRNFAISRFFRLYPAYWLSLALFLALCAASGRVFAPAQIAANLTMVQAGLGQADIIGVYWTLFYELIFYFLCAVAYSLRWLESARIVLALSLALCLAAFAAAILHFIQAPIRPPLGLAGYLSIMFFGTYCRFAFLQNYRVARRWLPVAIAGICAMVASVAFLGYAYEALPDRPMADFLGVYLGIALFLAAFGFKAFLSRPVMIWLGNISYSLYLMHVACVMVGGAIAMHLATGGARVATILATIPLSFLVAHLCAKFIEKPMIKLGKAIIRKGRREPVYEGVEPAP